MALCSSSGAKERRTLRHLGDNPTRAARIKDPLGPHAGDPLRRGNDIAPLGHPFDHTKLSRFKFLRRRFHERRLQVPCVIKASINFQII